MFDETGIDYVRERPPSVSAGSLPAHVGPKWQDADASADATTESADPFFAQSGDAFWKAAIARTSPATAPTDVAHAKLKEHAAALEKAGHLTEAIPLLETIQGLERDNQENLLHLASLQVKNLNYLRAAKFLKEYLAGHPGQETVQNAFGTALFRVEPQQWNGAYWSFRDAYRKYDESLALAKQNGKQRWGTHWVADAEAQQHWQEVEAAQQAVVFATARLTRAKGYLVIVTRDGEEHIRHPSVLSHSVERDKAALALSIQKADEAIHRLEPYVDAANDRYLQMRPPFPNEIDLEP